MLQATMLPSLPIHTRSEANKFTSKSAVLVRTLTVEGTMVAGVG